MNKLYIKSPEQAIYFRDTYDIPIGNIGASYRHSVETIAQILPAYQYGQSSMPTVVRPGTTLSGLKDLFLIYY